MRDLSRDRNTCLKMTDSATGRGLQDLSNNVREILHIKRNIGWISPS